MSAGIGRVGGQRGFVLVNALVIVVALAGAAVFLLARAEAGRGRLEASQQAAQLTFYLDAFDALAITVLNDDLNRSSHDHLGEAWARTNIAVPLDRGEVAGRIIDLQGRFNLNWLNRPNAPAVAATFDALLQANGIPLRAGDAIRAFIQPDGPANPRPFAAQTPPVAPVGGSLFGFEQLADVPGLSTEMLARLREVATVLPATSAVNLNTAPAEMIAGLLPDVPSGTLMQVLRQRDRTPFQDAQEFRDALEERLEAPVEALIGTTALTTATQWFRAESRARLGGQDARRDTILLRLGRQSGTRAYWRYSRF